MKRKLTHKQQLFIDHYLTCWNATRAAELAGYKAENGSLRVIGSTNLTKVNIKSEIEKRLKESHMSADEALKREAEIARFDMSAYIDGYGKRAVLRIDEMIKDGFGHMIREVYQTSEGTRVKVADPDSARERILKAHGRFVNKTELIIPKPIKFIDYGLNEDDADTD